MDFTKPEAFEVMRKLRRHEVSAFLMAVAALEHGLDVTFYLSQAEAGTRQSLFPDQFDTPVFYAVLNGRKRHFFHATLADTASRSTADVTRDKVATKALLHRKNIDTAVGGAVSARKPQLLFDLARAGVQRFVLKPVTGSLGNGAQLDQTPQQAAEVLRMNPTVDYVIEQHIRGREHRVYVVDDRVVAAYGYVPPYVTGDGTTTLRALYARHQAERAGNPFVVDRKPPMAEIDLALLMQKLDWDAVPEAGREVRLSTTPFPDAQGEFHVCTDTMPDRLRQIALQAAKAVASRNCAIDIMVSHQGNPYVLEVNIKPMIGTHCFPFPGSGWNLDVPVAILHSHFRLRPESRRGLAALDHDALWRELMRDGRAGGGVAAARFARFED